MKPLNYNKIYFLLFLQGFSSLSIEVITLRLMAPFFGTAITVTAPVIGFFLAALSLGYYCGTKKSLTDRQISHIFLWVALSCGILLSTDSFSLIQAVFKSRHLMYVVIIAHLTLAGFLLSTAFTGLVLRLTSEGQNQKIGPSMFWSTLGSVLSCMLLPLVLMPIWGLWSAVIATVIFLVLAHLVMQSKWFTWPVLIVLISSGYVANRSARHIQTAYADYNVQSTMLTEDIRRDIFFINSQVAAWRKKDLKDGRIRYANYIREFRRFVNEELKLLNGEILVLGAGGFTASEGDNRNIYTYVDIDPNIKEIAEKKYLEKPINGHFVAADAREYAANTEKKYDIVFADVFSDAEMKIPENLVTQEFWSELGRILKPGGFLYINVIVDQRMQSPYVNKLIATIESVYGFCEIKLVNRESYFPNAAVICRPELMRKQAEAGQPQYSSPVYLDQKNDVIYDDIIIKPSTK